MSAEARQRWLECVSTAVRTGTLVKLSLAAPNEREPQWRRLRLRPVTLRAGPRLQCVWEGATQDLTKNFEIEEGLARLEEWLGSSFGSANAVTTTQIAQLDLRSGKSPRLTFTPTTARAIDAAHDRVKTRRVDARQPWLHALGVTTAQGSVGRGMEAKFRQIHRFVELLEPLLAAAELTSEGVTDRPGPLRVVDMGCGKGYLTFAVHEHLRGATGRAVSTIGVEVRVDLVTLANRVASETGCVGLEFQAGAIADTPLDRPDVLVALHACDTATDDALAAGIAAGASLLVVAPCCQKEVRSQMVAPVMWAGIWRHGIFRERQAEFATDALRALLLEFAGYDPRVFEFVAPEHTAKNLMIAAVKRRIPGDSEAALRRVRELAAGYGITHQRLADLLRVKLEP